MLKVECLNNSLWNHLDKIIVVAIVKEPESDRMRQKKKRGGGRGKKKKKAGTRVSLSCKVKRISAPLFSLCLSNLEGLHLTTEHPPLAACQKWTPAWKPSGWGRDLSHRPSTGMGSFARHGGGIFFVLFFDCLPGKSRTVAPALH